ncbi:WXG100 family type VII secretion target [Microbacterium sp. 2FI]|uniref:WXG100 family type VII secretion target n=1 Tax=Microbacterium sp. 2FI TaxID=2502193 RepID=UPI0010F8A3DE|nr:WXG100 family type VII secretion target [Microbacterium sp. 2FI]
MAVFSVDSDAVLASTTAVRGTIERIQAETNAMMAQLTQMQSTWTGSASLAFHGVVDQWRATQRQVEDSLAGINVALGAAARQYADAELSTTSLFR